MFCHRLCTFVSYTNCLYPFGKIITNSKNELRSIICWWRYRPDKVDANVVPRCLHWHWIKFWNASGKFSVYSLADITSLDLYSKKLTDAYKQSVQTISITSLTIPCHMNLSLILWILLLFPWCPAVGSTWQAYRIFSFLSLKQHILEASLPTTAEST